MDLSSNRARIFIQGYIDTYSTSYQSSMQKLSSGAKYTSSAENPVEYFSGEKISGQIHMNKNLINSISSGADLLTIAEGTETEVANNIHIIKDLCLQAANGTYTAEDKDKILSEIRGRLEYIESASSTTKYAGRNLLDGSTTYIPIQVSTTANDSINIAEPLLDVRTASLGIDLDPAVTGATWSYDDIQTYITSLNTASDSITVSLTNIGNYESRLDTASEKLSNMNINLTDLHSFYADGDVAEVSAEIVQAEILQKTSVTILAQANSMTGKVYSLLNS